jgi:hypothetical protein
LGKGVAMRVRCETEGRRTPTARWPARRRRFGTVSHPGPLLLVFLVPKVPLGMRPAKLLLRVARGRATGSRASRGGFPSRTSAAGRAWEPAQVTALTPSPLPEGEGLSAPFGLGPPRQPVRPETGRGWEARRGPVVGLKGDPRRGIGLQAASDGWGALQGGSRASPCHVVGVRCGMRHSRQPAAAFAGDSSRAVPPPWNSE